MIRTTARLEDFGTHSAPLVSRPTGEVMSKKQGKHSMDKSIKDHREESDEKSASSSEPTNAENENPPRTTSKGWLTTPKFGSATSGGGEIEPGTERD